ncbi:hypothetical protein ACKWTF_015895 [Chironomus riparius]
MASNQLQIFQQCLKSSTILFNLAILIIFIALCPQQSSQQDMTVQATCDYNYDSKGIYTCDFNISAPVNSTYFLDITGIHLDNHTDADVKAVNIQNATFVSFNEEVMKKFANLMILNFNGGKIQEFSPNSFEACQNLEIITSVLHQVTTFPPQMLKNCKKLRIFDVYGQNLEEVPEDLFGMTENLEEFRLMTFKITSLPEKLLQNMKNLTILGISGNELTELHPNFLIAAVNLEHVDISFNKFEDQLKLTYALNGHPNVKKLFLQYNYFNHFDFRFFSQFQKLEELNIGIIYKNLSDISWKSLPSSMLHLSIDNIAEDILENSLDRLVNLKSLNLSGRGIMNLQKDIFKTLTNLEMLEIFFTNIKSLHPEMFMNLINLSDLKIRNNKIQDLPAGIFASLVNLGIKSDNHGLKMTSNEITRLNADSFGLHPHLRFIEFSGNKINEIEPGIFSKFNSNLTHAYFYINKCVDGKFSGENLDDNDAFSLCFKNWEEIVPTTEATTEDTTPGSAGFNFKKFEIFAIIFIGLLSKLMQNM